MKIIVLSSHGYLTDYITREVVHCGKRSNSKSASIEISLSIGRIALSSTRMPLHIYPRCATVLCTVKRNYFALSNQISKLSLNEVLSFVFESVKKAHPYHFHYFITYFLVTYWVFLKYNSMLIGCFITIFSLRMFRNGETTFI